MQTYPLSHASSPGETLSERDPRLVKSPVHSRQGYASTTAGRFVRPQSPPPRPFRISLFVLRNILELRPMNRVEDGVACAT
ncbi:hypothetical protein OPV22_004192 [Ensete ventricosum]|uniref:Uncharacterized protein n=1 Tax=Ensete ventricosum TaxID=4639 RepID=A0AAV8S311_ENSVE|nr:hypothetical protein OPV22_004192 [Ensete ventricosum]